MWGSMKRRNSEDGISCSKSFVTCWDGSSRRTRCCTVRRFFRRTFEFRDFLNVDPNVTHRDMVTWLLSSNHNHRQPSTLTTLSTTSPPCHVLQPPPPQTTPAAPNRRRPPNKRTRPANPHATKTTTTERRPAPNKRLRPPNQDDNPKQRDAQRPRETTTSAPYGPGATNDPTG